MAEKYSTVYCSTCFRFIIVISLTALGALWLYFSKPIPVIRGTEPLSIIVPAWYMLMAFPVLGMLLGDFIELLILKTSKLPALELAFQILLLVYIGNTRLLKAIPVSGHAMLFSYFIIRRLMVGRKSGLIPVIELSIAILFSLITIYMKLFVWDDPMTLAYGAITGITLGIISIIFYRLKISTL